ncbi:MAG TPA: dihydrolipoamide acetyltransferase family protein [Candidatus Acidoferrum sp.]|jgi:pyruvate dehydrogenase E2 component (dihydrolipoamide acetyltransferase)|nr:dihydrolipoamide acetyltransferase family protein [Candidatus Acidoferrum sp.]
MAVSKVVMPKLSEQMETGKIIKWLKQEGDRIQSGDILAEVETDKADVEMEAFGSGVLRKILVQAGAAAPVGALIGVIAEPGDDIASVVSQAGGAAPAAAAAPAPKPAPATAGATEMANRPAAVPPQPRREDPAARTPAPATGPTAVPPPAQPAAPSDGTGRVKASPLARKIAAQSGVDLRLLHGSGPGGRVVRRDVEAASTGGAAAVAVPVADGAEFEDRPLSQMRAIIAKRMPLSKAPVPHFYVSSEVAMDRGWALREELNALEGQPKISINDFVIRACALALLQHPGVNASFQGDSIRVFHRAHIGIAVALEEGLITPVLRDAHAKSLAQIAIESRDLAERARQRKLRAPEMSGATFSISNLGMFDVTEFSAIINPPEGAILAVGTVRTIPVVTDAGLGVGRRMMLTISCDHRVMDGAMGARFLQDVKHLLEEPLRLLI